MAVAVQEPITSVDLDLAKTVSDSMPNTGDPVTFRVRVRNARYDSQPQMIGPAATATPLVALQTPIAAASSPCTSGRHVGGATVSF